MRFFGWFFYLFLQTDLIHSVANIINGITMQERCDEAGNEKLLSYVHLVIEGYALYDCISFHFQPEEEAKKIKRRRQGNNVNRAAISVHENTWENSFVKQ